MQGTSTAGGGIAAREWLLAALLAACFAPAIFALSAVWSEVDYQSHGFLVPVVSLWVLLRERNRWPTLETLRDRRGLVVMVAALVLYLLGLATGDVSLQGVALVGAIAGAVLFARGPEWLRHLRFPIGFLLFMVPVPPSWITPLIVKLQLFVSIVGLAIVRALGGDVFREGNVMYLPTGESLFVAEACSGVTSIITLAPLGVLLAYYTLRRPGTRLLLVLSVIPLAMAGNLTRVVLVTLGAIRFGVHAAAEGPAHGLAGVFTYAVACGLLLAASGLLRRYERGASGAAARTGI